MYGRAYMGPRTGNFSHRIQDGQASRIAGTSSRPTAWTSTIDATEKVVKVSRLAWSSREIAKFLSKQMAVGLPTNFGLLFFIQLRHARFKTQIEPVNPYFPGAIS